MSKAQIEFNELLMKMLVTKIKQLVVTDIDFTNIDSFEFNGKTYFNIGFVFTARLTRGEIDSLKMTVEKFWVEHNLELDTLSSILIMTGQLWNGNHFIEHDLFELQETSEEFVLLQLSHLVSSYLASVAGMFEQTYSMNHLKKFVDIGFSYKTPTLPEVKDFSFKEGTLVIKPLFDNVGFDSVPYFKDGDLLEDLHYIFHLAYQKRYSSDGDFKLKQLFTKLESIVANVHPTVDVVNFTKPIPSELNDLGALLKRIDDKADLTEVGVSNKTIGKLRGKLSFLTKLWGK